ncbi:MAG: type IV pilus inner membrane component PilO [Gemmatimonadaceae bacterium]
MAGLPQNQRDQVMLLVGILGLALAGAYYYFVHMPKAAELEVLAARVESLDAQNQRAKAVVARGTVEDLRAEAERLRDNLELMRTLIPVSNEVPALLDQILGAARRTGLEFSNFAPSATIQGGQFDTYRFRMSMQGSYHQIGELLTAIGSLRRIVTPINVSLAPSPVSAARAAKPRDPEEPLLTANFDIQTYVVKVAPVEDQ